MDQLKDLFNKIFSNMDGLFSFFKFLSIIICFIILKNYFFNGYNIFNINILPYIIFIIINLIIYNICK